jgi:hypothetical protein
MSIISFRLGLTTYRNASTYTWKSNILLSIINTSPTFNDFIQNVSYSIPFDITLNILTGEIYHYILMRIMMVEIIEVRILGIYK